jgi:hypothetical protein
LLAHKLQKVPVVSIFRVRILFRQTSIATESQRQGIGGTTELGVRLVLLYFRSPRVAPCCCCCCCCSPPPPASHACVRTRLRHANNAAATCLAGGVSTVHALPAGQQSQEGQEKMRGTVAMLSPVSPCSADWARSAPKTLLPHGRLCFHGCNLPVVFMSRDPAFAAYSTPATTAH